MCTVLSCAKHTSDVHFQVCSLAGSWRCRCCGPGWVQDLWYRGIHTGMETYQIQCSSAHTYALCVLYTLLWIALQGVHRVCMHLCYTSCDASYTTPDPPTTTRSGDMRWTICGDLIRILHSMQCRVYIHYVCPLLLPVYSTRMVCRSVVVYITTSALPPGIRYAIPPILASWDPGILWLVDVHLHSIPAVV